MAEDRLVTITCTEKQAQILEQVCDAYSRMLCGQLRNSFQDICEMAWAQRNKTDEHPHGIGSKEWYEMREGLEKSLKDFEYKYWGLSDGRYNGVGYNEQSDILWDMHQSLRYARWCNMPKDKKEDLRCTVIANTPMAFGDEPLIDVEY